MQTTSFVAHVAIGLFCPKKITIFGFENHLYKFYFCSNNYIISPLKLDLTCYIIYNCHRIQKDFIVSIFFIRLALALINKFMFTWLALSLICKFIFAWLAACPSCAECTQMCTKKSGLKAHFVVWKMLVATTPWLILLPKSGKLLGFLSLLVHRF